MMGILMSVVSIRILCHNYLRTYYVHFFQISVAGHPRAKPGWKMTLLTKIQWFLIFCFDFEKFNFNFLFACIYSGPCILRPPLQSEKYGLNWEVVLKWRDIYIENARMVSLMADLKRFILHVRLHENSLYTPHNPGGGGPREGVGGGGGWWKVQVVCPRLMWTRNSPLRVNRWCGHVSLSYTSTVDVDRSPSLAHQPLTWTRHSPLHINRWCGHVTLPYTSTVDVDT